MVVDVAFWRWRSWFLFLIRCNCFRLGGVANLDVEPEAASTSVFRWAEVEHSSGGLQSVHCLAPMEHVVSFLGHDLQLALFNKDNIVVMTTWKKMKFF